MRHLTDSQLVDRALAGAADAYREIVARYERPLLSLIQRMVKDPALAEDLAQESFVKAFRKLRKFDRERKLSSWLFKIAHNTTIDHLRRGQLRLVPLEASTGDGEETWEVIAAPAEEEPDRRAEHAEELAGISAALGRLKPQYREILLLRFHHGLAYHEIAEVMGIKMNTVKVQLHRARKQLAAELAATGFSPPARFVE